MDNKSITFDFYKNALARNLCGEYNSYWKTAMRDKKALFELSLKIGAIPYMAVSMYSGWGLTTEYLKDNFGDYINGKYIIHDDSGHQDVTKSAYYGYSFNETPLQNDIMAIYDCHGTLNTLPFGVNHLFVSNDSNIDIHLKEHSYLWIYLFDKSKIELNEVANSNHIHITRYSDDCGLSYTDRGGKVYIRRRDVNGDAFGDTYKEISEL